ncbi:hypothetical protein DK427_06490 [Methylobacterium radiodurans]|uniref:Uncharacterized protein n=1 Tax=Methylobacterium radiodurans TaxID=2202828 RepID=A0A2U8VPL4_9HYPH|nr:hypothetical protein DK427_06490 [Methylobacterium radiodurans]
MSELEQQVDFLMRERILYTEGPQALEAKAPTTEPAPPGYAYGNAGQLVLADHELVYRHLWGDLPVKPVERFRKPDAGGS